MATPRRNPVVPFRATEPAAKKKARPWAELIAETEITPRTPVLELPVELIPVEVAAWLRLGRDGAYSFAEEHGERIGGKRDKKGTLKGGRLRVPRSVLEELASKNK